MLRACEKLETYYDTEKYSGNVITISNEIEVIEEDFTEVEGIEKGYLSGANRSSAKDQTTKRRSIDDKKLAKSKRKSSKRTRNAKDNLNRTFVARNRRHNQTKQRQQLPIVNYATDNESRKGNQNNSKRFRCPGSRHVNKILVFKSSRLYLHLLILQALQPVLERWPDCLRLHSPGWFICPLHLHRFILRI